MTGSWAHAIRVGCYVKDDPLSTSVKAITRTLNEYTKALR